MILSDAEQIRLDTIRLHKVVLWEEAKGKLNAMLRAHGQAPVCATPSNKLKQLIKAFTEEVEHLELTDINMDTKYGWEEQSKA